MFSVKTPKIEAMEKDERGNGDALLCISQAVVILSPRLKVITVSIVGHFSREWPQCNVFTTKGECRRRQTEGLCVAQ